MDYRVHIKQFDGPLDLLLHLIEKSELDIRDIFISEITAEFLEYMKQLDELDLDQASEFLTVAATLVYAKSRSLFPPEPKAEDEEEDPAEQLIRRLKEYKAFKEASEAMRSLAESAAQMRTKQPEEFPLPPKEIILRDTTVERLFEAMLSALDRAAKAEPEPTVHAVRKDTYTVRSCSRRIRELLVQNKGRAAFSAVTAGAGRMELIVTFMALLEMIGGGEIRVEQKEYCGEIMIFEQKLVKNDAALNYMDEQD